MAFHEALSDHQAVERTMVHGQLVDSERVLHRHLEIVERLAPQHFGMLTHRHFQCLIPAFNPAVPTDEPSFSLHHSRCLGSKFPLVSTFMVVLPMNSSVILGVSWRTFDSETRTDLILCACR